MSSFILRYESHIQEISNHENVALGIYGSAIQYVGVLLMCYRQCTMYKTDFCQLEMILENDKQFETLPNI